MREPSFWWGEASLASALLAPLAAIYGAVARARFRARGRRAGAAVVCIGNFTVGGAGKTPTALAVARMLAGAGEQPVFLSRGYGGTLAGPVLVDPTRHRAQDVGDEPLLLARTAPTIVARNRVKGAAIAAGASVIVMDDGFHNPSLVKDFSVLVVDARRGIGNGRVIPAGPLRAPLEAQLARARAQHSGFAGALAPRRGLSRAARRQPRARLCRHRRSGEIFLNPRRRRRCGCRHANLSRPSRLHARRGEGALRAGGPRGPLAGDDGKGSRTAYRRR